MSTAVKRLYEGLFLVDSNEAASDWKGVNDAIERVLSRADADVVSLKKWDDRRLAYEVKRKNRGTYILSYFNVDPLKLTAIERDVQLSEQILRVMVLRTDKMSKEDIDRDVPLEVVAKAEAEETARVEARAAEAAAAAEAKAAEAEAKAAEEAKEAPAEDSPAEEVTEDAPVAEEEVAATEEAPAEEAPKEE